MSDRIIEGGCACEAVRFTARGEPIRAGLCHCLTCRKAHGSAFNAFVVYAREAVEFSGETRIWQTPTGFTLHFCPGCGSQVSGETIGGPEVEVSLGSFDRPGEVSPQYESWTIRREPWLAALPITQNERDPQP
jgi:hypothetical protein